MASFRVCVVILSQLISAAAFAPMARTSCAAPSRPASHLLTMMAGPGEGFNSFRRLPSASSVSLTSDAMSFFGLMDDKTTLQEMRDCHKCDDDILEKTLQDMPMPDQRGEKVLLDVDGQGHLHWIKVV